FDRVAPLAEEADAQKPLEALGGDQLRENPFAQLRRQRLWLRSDALPDPVFLGGAGDVAGLRFRLSAADAAHPGGGVAPPPGGSPPARPPVQSSRSRSQIVRPYVAMSSSGWLATGRRPSGSMSASRCPLTRYALISSRTRACFSISPRRLSGRKAGLRSCAQRYGWKRMRRSSKIRS